MGNHHTKQSSPAGEGDDVGTIVSSEDPTDSLRKVSFLNEETETSEGLQRSIELTIEDGEHIAVFHLFYLVTLWLLLGDDHLQSSITDENASALFEFADYFGIESLKAAILREQRKREVYEIKRVAISERRRVAVILKQMEEERHAECQRKAARVAEAERHRAALALAEQRAEAHVATTRRANAAEVMRLRLKRGLITLKGCRRHWSREGSQQHAMATPPIVENRSRSGNYSRYRGHDSDESDVESWSW